MTFDTYLADLPMLHTWDGGKSWNSGGFQPEHLRRMHDLIDERRRDKAMSIIETGAGNSTLTFLQLTPNRVVSIAPGEDLHQRIIAAAAAHGIDSGPLDFRPARSEIALPAMAISGETHDLALIDGGHGWPTVFVDFCYLNMMLREGGLLLIDDVGIYAIAELTNLLADQPEYRLIEDMGKLQVWEKLVNRAFLPGHSLQPYIEAQTRKGRLRRRLRHR